MKTISICLPLALVFAATSASAGIVIDDFEPTDGISFATVTGYDSGPYGAAPVGFDTSTTGHIVGGSRDMEARVVDVSGYPGDNNYLTASIQSGVQFGDGFANMWIGYGGKASFTSTYDGAGIGDNAAGLDLDLAATGDRLNVGILYSAALDGFGGNPLIPMTLTLTDAFGRNASVTRQALSSAVYVQSFDFLFSGFEADNNAFDLHHVDRIAFTVEYNEASYLSSYFEVSGIGTSGAAYTTTNTVPLPTPEPASWAMMLLGFGALGFGMRRRAVVFA